MKYATPEGIDSGDSFGSLAVLRFVGRDSGYRARFAVLCVCGSETIVLGSNLKKGNTQQCNSSVHRLKHGKYGTAEYQAWQAMKWRVKCARPEIARVYRDRGISVHPAWVKSFEDFLSHIGLMPKPGLTLDRENNELGYVPGNVRWATWEVQANNKRKKVA